MTRERTPKAHSTETGDRRHLGSCAQLIGEATAVTWRCCQDRTALCAILGRYSAHLAIVALALVIGVLSRVAVLPAHLAELPAEVASLPAEQAAPMPAPSELPEGEGYRSTAAKAITRQANPLTTIPDRERLDVITYTVQQDDTVFGIALMFDLSPYSIVWCNMEALKGAPWLLAPGLTLVIPPVDGAYHTVQSGETTNEIAETYDVDTNALYNKWNDIEPGATLAEGTLLLIPGGVGDDFDWEPPPPDTTVTGAAETWTYAGGSAAQAASGAFGLPTGSYAVSGWTFRDPRNPGHIGLDYRCRLGDPIYAADAGKVVYAGWGAGYGNLVKVDHGNGFVTYYAHFTSFAVGLGQPVSRGQVVGYCGSTGYSSGPHLHYEIRLNGAPQNPRLYEP